LLFSLSIRSCTDYQIFTSKREKLELHPKMWIKSQRRRLLKNKSFEDFEHSKFYKPKYHMKPNEIAIKYIFVLESINDKFPRIECALMHINACASWMLMLTNSRILFYWYWLSSFQLTLAVVCAGESRPSLVCEQ
jgi:hypothetical protein